jgi:hypothetical protein
MVQDTQRNNSGRGQVDDCFLGAITKSKPTHFFLDNMLIFTIKMKNNNIMIDVSERIV